MTIFIFIFIFIFMFLIGHDSAKSVIESVSDNNKVKMITSMSFTFIVFCLLFLSNNIIPLLIYSIGYIIGDYFTEKKRVEKIIYELEQEGDNE